MSSSKHHFLNVVTKLCAVLVAEKRLLVSPTQVTMLLGTIHYRAYPLGFARWGLLERRKVGMVNHLCWGQQPSNAFIILRKEAVSLETIRDDSMADPYVTKPFAMIVRQVEIISHGPVSLQEIWV